MMNKKSQDDKNVTRQKFLTPVIYHLGLPDLLKKKKLHQTEVLILNLYRTLIPLSRKATVYCFNATDRISKVKKDSLVYAAKSLVEISW